MANTLNLGNGNWATKKDSLLAYNNENNNFKPLPFDFTRASNATVVNKAGLIETVGGGEPRIDFSNDAKGALLLEPQRTNLIQTSASGAYGNPPASVTNTISPDGTNNAVIPIPNSTSDRYQYEVTGGSYATNTKLAYSWYRKRISTPIESVYIGDLRFNTLVNVTQLGSTTQIESNINGFDRFEAIFNITDGSVSSLIRPYFGQIIGVGNSSVAYFGHQLEQGSYSTSYIPTIGSAVTRVADVCDSTGNGQVINSTEGVFYIEAASLANDGQYNTVSLKNSATSNYANTLNITYSSTTNQILAVYRVSTTSVVVLSKTLNNALDFNKIAFKYKSGEFALWVNGIEEDTDSNTTMLSSGILDEVIFYRSDNSSKFKAKIKDLRIYNTSLTDAELQALTK